MSYTHPAPLTLILKYEGVFLKHSETYTRCEYPDGAVYRGHLSAEALRHGCGRMAYSGGDVYEGEWESNQRSGVGLFVAAESVYVGDWADDKYEGIGKLVQANGSVYEGEFQNGMPHGSGWSSYLWESADEGAHEFAADDESAHWLVYDGSWLQAQRHGHGQLTYPDGSTYEGQWQDGRRVGSGRYVLATGQAFEVDGSDTRAHPALCGHLASQGYDRFTNA